MLSRNAAKVGAVVLLSLALALVLYTQLAHLAVNSYRVQLKVDDTQGLSAQSVVRMEGVAVGEVASVDLDSNNKPVIYLAIKKKYRIPKDFRFKITSGILITQAQVQIMPPDTKPGSPPTPPTREFVSTDGKAVVTGARAPSSLLETVDPELHSTFVKLNETFSVITDRFTAASSQIDVVLKQTQQLMATANKIAGSTNDVVSDPKLKANLIASLDNVRLTTQDAHLITTQLRRDMDDLVGSSKENLKDLGTKVNTLLGHLDDTVDDAHTLMQKFTEQVTDPHLQQSLQETAELARVTIARFNQIASDIHTLTGDPALQGDIKITMAHLKDAAEHGSDALQKVDQMIGKFTDATHKAPKIPHIEVQAEVSEQLSHPLNRIDLEALMPFGRGSLIFAGLNNIGQSTALDLQAGQYLTKELDVRGGIFAGKVGAGLDWWASPGTGIRADLYDTNKTRLDVRGLFRVNRNASLWVGGENLFNTTIPMIGIQLTN